MTPAPTAAPSLTEQQSPRLKQRRNAMANVMDGMSSHEINAIRVNAPASLDTGRTTCISTTTTASTSTSSPARRSTSNSSFSDMESDGSTSELMEGVNGSGLAALALRSSNSPMTSPMQSPSLKYRRNGVANVLAEVDEESLRRITSQADGQRHSSSQDDHIFTY